VSKILAFTVTHGARRFLPKLVPDMRGAAGAWFDWLVVLSGADAEQHAAAQALLNDPDRKGIQHLLSWEENRGQHWAFDAALRLAREQGYEWLIRIDDDIRSKTKGWLRAMHPGRYGMLDRLEWLRVNSGDMLYRVVAAPRVVGLRNPIRVIESLNIPDTDQPFRAELVPILGGALRIHNVDYFRDFKAEFYSARGRRDPEAVGRYVQTKVGLLVRFPDISIVHPTDELEGQETEEEKRARAMGHYWPWLETEKI